MRNQIFTHYNVPRLVRSDPSASPQESALRRIGQAPQLAGLASHTKKVESQPECLEVSSEKCRKAVDFCSLWARGVQHVLTLGITHPCGFIWGIVCRLRLPATENNMQEEMVRGGKDRKLISELPGL